MKTYDLELIQVLWVEDDPYVTTTYPLKAENFGIQLVPFSCWDDAKKELEENYDRWSAIILDAKCKYHQDSKDNSIVFLREALKDIAAFSIKQGRIIPWYILTGGDDDIISDSINDDRMEWDKDWTESKQKKYYSKNVDNEMLFRRIRCHATFSNRLQIQKIYKDVFEAINLCGIDISAKIALEDLLEPIHFIDAKKNIDYNDKFAKAREVLECIFRSMASHGILPDWGKQVNLSWSSYILSGNNACRKNREGKEEVVIKSNKAIASPVIQKLLREMVSIIPAFCHSDNTETDEIKKGEYLNHVDSSTFLLKSFTLQLCDMVLWYKNYLQDHSNTEENRQCWQILLPRYLNNSKISSK